MAQTDLTRGPVKKTMFCFALPMICGNLLQQLYNIVDTLIVGRYLGADAVGVFYWKGYRKKRKSTF